MTVPMSNVSMDLTAEEFITSESAKVIFSATLALTDPNIDSKAEVISAARRLHESDNWYVTGVYRQEDASGIEVVTYTLALRVAENLVNQIKASIKEINRAGLKFTLTDIDYTPTQAQIEEGNKALRSKVYAKANEELEILNNATAQKESDEKWVIGTINFSRNQGVLSKSIRASGSMMYENAGLAAAGGFNDDEGDGGVTQKLTLQAQVIFTRKIYNRL